MAKEYGHQSSLKLLTQFAAPLEMPDEAGNQPLHLATLRNHRDCMSILLKNGVDIDAAARHTGRTALHLAARENLLDAAKLLIQRGANVNAIDDNGESGKLIDCCRFQCLHLIREPMRSASFGRGQRSYIHLHIVGERECTVIPQSR